ncbi:hypothetical protein EPUS_06116 [Endocarpon pusillum Z07020]|uniref:Uncharacterized protein n=1 Tax=Endocarpon pusillum (strain Z07020 / HMAS-L-300199) TaxID=1263415 RepID=U1HPN5_ENDPU|nr:uncharacterized protein EPUS_06116 [Endocarpon pusillum Z07020]ERF72360.1 hypothetical protein EPUS_06116 [Endocarpon pusillum Z07020]
MAEPVQIIASCIGVADFALKSYRGLYRFVSDIKNADNTAKGLCCKVQRLRKTLYNVHLVLLARENQLLETRPAGPEEECILSNIRDSLKQWRHTLQKFKREIKGLNAPLEGDRRPTWVDKTLLQLKLQRKAPTIAKFEKSIDEHIEELSLSLHCLAIFVQTEPHVHGPTLRQKLQQVEPQHNGTRNRHDLSKSRDGSEVKNRHAQIMERCITTARTVVERVSPRDRPSVERQTSIPEQDGTIVGLPRGSHEQDREDENSDEPGVRISEIGEVTVTAPSIGSNERQIPDFDPQLDITPQEFLDALIEKYRSQVELELKDKCYDQAQVHQRRLIDRFDERKTAYGVQYEWAKMQEKLADILERCGKIDEAIEINHLLLQGVRDVTGQYPRQTDIDQAQLSPPKALEQSRHYYKIAKLRIMQYAEHGDPRTIQLSEVFGRRSFKLRLGLREEHESEFLESAEFLANIYQLQGNQVEADTYRDFYLRSPPTSPASSAPASPVSPLAQQISLDGHRLNGDINGHESSVTPSFDASVLTSLFSAVAKGDDNEVAGLLRCGMDVDSRDHQNRTPLMHAIERRRIGMVKFLCSKGAKVDAKDNSGWTALHHAIVYWDGDSIARILLEDYRADCNAVCRLQKTPLHYTVGRNNLSSARILLAHGANIQAKDSYQRTPLSFAESEGRGRLAKILRDYEANMNR